MTGGAPSAAVGWALTFVLAMTGCAAADGPQDTPRPLTDLSSSNAVTTGAPRDDGPTDARTASAQARDVAQRAMARFCRPRLTRQAWTAGLHPLLALAAAGAYSTVDSSRVGCARVTGPPHAGAGDGYTRLYSVPTDAGVYRVTLTRMSLSDRWLVFHIAPVSAP